LCERAGTVGGLKHRFWWTLGPVRESNAAAKGYPLSDGRNAKRIAKLPSSMHRKGTRSKLIERQQEIELWSLPEAKRAQHTEQLVHRITHA